MTGSRQTIDWSQVRRRLAEADEVLMGTDAPAALEDLYRERAQRLARPRAQSTSPNGRLFLGFRLGVERYGIPLENLAEVAPLRRCAAVPGWPRSLAGVANRRGTLVPVLDLHRLLGLPARAEGPGYVLFLRGRPPVGLQVDAIESVDVALDGAFAGTAGPAGPLVRAVSQDGLILLDAEKILELELLGGRAVQP